MSKNKKNSDSNGFWDRFKDFLYDNIDYIFMVIVVLVVALIINWRLGGLFGDTKVIRDDIKDKGEKIETDTKKSEDKKNKIDYKTEEDDDEEDKKEKTGEVIKISIPKGSASQTVCDILLENKLIDDKKDFMEYIEKKQVETKLKYGKYEIPEGSNYDEIIEILTK